MALKENPALLPADVVRRAKELGSALLADGMKGLGFEMEGCMEAAIMPLDMGMRMAGTAITVETSDGDNFPIHLATYSGGEGYVMVIDGKACEHTAYFGGLISGAAKAIGYEGIVCDGLVRDKDDCIAMGFPVFAKGIIQRGPKKANPGKLNEPIRCGGIPVKPGDLIVGDCDGVTVVPRELIEQAIEKAEVKKAYEDKRVETIEAYARARAQGEPLPQLAPQWVLDMMN